MNLLNKTCFCGKSDLKINNRIEPLANKCCKDFYKLDIVEYYDFAIHVGYQMIFCDNEEFTFYEDHSMDAKIKTLALSSSFNIKELMYSLNNFQETKSVFEEFVKENKRLEKLQAFK